MKLSTAKSFIRGFRGSVRKRGETVDHEKLHAALIRFQSALEFNQLLGKY